jgi:hypothetical protein
MGWIKVQLLSAALERLILSSIQHHDSIIMESALVTVLIAFLGYDYLIH